MSWFEDLTGFRESEKAVRTHLTLSGPTLHSSANGREMHAGTLTTPTLESLETEAIDALHSGALTADQIEDKPMTVCEVVADARQLHNQQDNAGAFFQVASQFNLLEMVSPTVTPEVGVTGYANDRTQGPVCAIACGAGTIVRNWLVDVDGQSGQTSDRQLDMLADVGTDLGNTRERLWKMRNGYALARRRATFDSAPDRHPQLRIGIHADTEVTSSTSGHRVTQAYCSALPVAYTRGRSATDLEPLARMILNSSYAATMAAAVNHVARGGTPRIFLTMVGGGVFGNEPEWITDAMHHAFEPYRNLALDVRIVSYGSPNPNLATVITDRAAP